MADTPRSDPSKRIPKSLNTDANLIGSYSLTDVAVALFPGVLVVLCTQLLFPTAVIAGYSVQTLTLPIAGVAITIGAIFVSLTPNYTNSLDWLQTVIGFYSNETEIEHDDAKEYTQVERIHPDQNAIERTDGALVGLVQVEPPNMALATGAEWAQKADAFQDFLNTVVEFPIQIYSSTRDFPVEEYLAHYESRLGDDDVKANPQLAALIENYIEWYETDLEQRQMTIRDHYVIVTVAPEEVQFEHESLVGKLAGVPLLGTLVRVWLAPSQNEQRDAMFGMLEQRLSRIERGLREIEGCGARAVPATEAVELLASFWAGEQIEYGDPEKAFQVRSILDAERATQ